MQQIDTHLFMLHKLLYKNLEMSTNGYNMKCLQKLKIISMGNNAEQFRQSKY